MAQGNAFLNKMGGVPSASGNIVAVAYPLGGSVTSYILCDDNTVKRTPLLNTDGTYTIGDITIAKGGNTITIRGRSGHRYAMCDVSAINAGESGAFTYKDIDDTTDVIYQIGGAVSSVLVIQLD